MCLPNKHCSGQLFYGAFHVLASDHCVVPVATSTGLVIVVVHHHTTSNLDVGDTQFVTSTRTNVS